MSDVITTDQYNFDFKDIVNFLKPFSAYSYHAFGMKLFEAIEEMEAIKRIRRPNAIHTTDQIVAWQQGMAGPLVLLQRICRSAV
ncbi:MAG: hypothetical protein CM1200mP40_01920 [Gammaproteobacteria bacterium]|nr:MAG: hypothetical protein CM1200mP40_01920 [Gammaproteobacteria bacterium]